MKELVTMVRGTTMTQFLAQVRAIYEDSLEHFRQSRLRAELPDADKLLGRRFDYRSDDLGASGPPIVGIL